MNNNALNTHHARNPATTFTVFGLFAFCQTLFVYCLLRANPFGDPDSFWHLAAGDDIRRLSRVPTTDSWAFTSDGFFWYNLSWLWDAGISFIHELGGFGLLYAITLLIYSAAIALQSHYAFKHGAKPQMVLLAAYVAACLTLAGLFLRPGMMSAFFGVLTYQCLSYYRDSVRKCWLLPLPIMTLLWVNMHGGFLLIFVLLGIFTLEAIWQNQKDRLVSLILCVLACLVATLINPYSYHIYEGAMRTLGSPLQNVIAEWLPLDAASPKQQLIALAVLLLVILSQFRNASIAFADRLLAVVLVVAVVTSVRHILLMSVLIIPYLSYCLPYIDMRPERQDKQELAAQQFTRHLGRPLLRIITIVIGLALITYTLTPTVRDVWLGQPAGFKKEALLEPEIAYIESNYPNMRFMNYYDLGGALIYSTRGKIPIFVDGREQTAYPPQLIRDVIYLNDWQGWNNQSEAILDRYKIDGIILPNNGIENAKLNPRLKEVFKGPAATIFLRRKL